MKVQKHYCWRLYRARVACCFPLHYGFCTTVLRSHLRSVHVSYAFPAKKPSCVILFPLPVSLEVIRAACTVASLAGFSAACGVYF